MVRAGSWAFTASQVGQNQLLPRRRAGSAAAGRFEAGRSPLFPYPRGRSARGGAVRQLGPTGQPIAGREDVSELTQAEEIVATLAGLGDWRGAMLTHLRGLIRGRSRPRRGGEMEETVKPFGRADRGAYRHPLHGRSLQGLCQDDLRQRRGAGGSCPRHQRRSSPATDAVQRG